MAVIRPLDISLRRNYQSEEVDMKTESILDKEKLIMIFYISVGDLSHNEAIVQLNEAQRLLERKFDKSVKPIVVPVYGQPTKVEAFSMNSVDKIELKELTERISDTFAAMKINKTDTERGFLRGCVQGFSD